MTKNCKIMLVVGEASGDTHAAMLVRSIREVAPHVNFEFFGSAGPKLREIGVEAVVNADDLAVVGVPEIARLLPMFLRTLRKLKSAANERKPDIAILVDFPEFNLKLARSLKKQGCKVVYYISPQLWAWRKYRVRTIRKYVDLLISILPFEKKWYAEHGVSHVEYVGNPLSQNVSPTMSKGDFCALHDISNMVPIVALLPGSRRTEISRILPVMLAAAAEVEAELPDVQFLIASANERCTGIIDTAIKNAIKAGSRMPGNMKVIEGATYDVLSAADAAAVTSGTATLETGIIGTPMVIVYDIAPLNYHLFKPLISVDFIGLINLIAEKRVANEFIQDDFTAETTKAELLRLLEPETNAAVRAELKIAADKLGHGGASKRAAEAILRVLAQK